MSENAALFQLFDALDPATEAALRASISRWGVIVPVIVDQDGNVRIGKGQGSAPMTLTELMDEMKQDKQFALAFKGTGSSGGGAAKSSGGTAGGNVSRIAAPANGLLGKDFIQNLDGLSKGTVTLDG